MSVPFQQPFLKSIFNPKFTVKIVGLSPASSLAVSEKSLSGSLISKLMIAKVGVEL